MSRSNPMETSSISIDDILAVIGNLPADAPYARRGGWFGSTKEQWLGWLREYDTPGYYNRKGTGYDAKFAYNHMLNHEMLLWLLEAAGLDKETLAAARTAADHAKSAAQKAGSVRKHVPWKRAVEVLWPAGK
jgi:hypothetical protein